MMVSGIVGRQPAIMSNNTKASLYGDFGGISSKSSDERSTIAPSVGGHAFTNGTKAWTGSIWGNSGLTAGFGSAARETSSTRDTGSLIGQGNDTLESKTGSGSLVASSESDLWGRSHSHWPYPDVNGSSASQSKRSPGVTSASYHAAAAAAAPQPFLNGFQPAFHAGNRSGLVGQQQSNGDVHKLNQLDSATASFAPSARPLHAPSVQRGMIGFDDGETQKVGSSSMTAWADAMAATDGRRSVSNSDYTGASSVAGSRNGSLPPSRHGIDSVQYPQGMDGFSRSSHTPASATGRGHFPSLSSQHATRSMMERADMAQSEFVSQLGRLNLHNSMESVSSTHKPSMSMDAVSSAIGLLPHENGHLRQQQIGFSHLAHGRIEDILPNPGSFTPDGYPSGQPADQLAAHRGLRSADKGFAIPANAEYHHSPYYPAGAAPTAFEPNYHPRGDQNGRAYASNGGHSAALERKLRHLQQEQQHFLHPQVQQVMAATQSKGAYNPYGYNGQNAMAVHGLGHPYPLFALQPMMPMMEPPKGPRDHETSHNLRSALLEDFKLNSKTKRWELKAIYNHIVEFSGDQHGSRFIQQKLETANSDEKDRVFREIEPNAMQLMTDVFGNYVIQKFFEHGDQNQKKVLANRMKGQVLNLSLQMYACRVVQKALEHILVDQQAALVKELDGSVLKCVKDQNGNHVIQKAIERVPAQHIAFIIDAFNGQIQQLATHAYGCRVIQRLLEHCEEPAWSWILDELHACGPTLIPDQYGNYVAQHVIEHGRPEDRAKVISLIKVQLLQFSAHKFASNVVEKCLVYATDEQRQEIMMKFLEKNERGESSLVRLIKDGYGNYVLQKLLDTLKGDDYAKFVEMLQPEMIKAKRIVTGKNVPAVEKKMRRLERFDLSRDGARPQSSSSSVSNTETLAAPAPSTGDTEQAFKTAYHLQHTSSAGTLLNNDTSKDFEKLNGVSAV